MDIKIMKLHPNAVMPKKAHESDFGFDVVAVNCEEVKPGFFKYDLGIAFEIVEGMGYEGYDLSIDARPRSSIWKTGMRLCNCEATIDYGYRGEVSLMFEHVRPEMPRYQVGDRIAQIKVGIAPKSRFVWVDELSNTERGGGAYGSSGK